MTQLTKSQKFTRSAKWTEDGDLYSLVATVRHDDECGNGHNSFSITGDLKVNGRWNSGGCIHDIIAERIPELAPFIKWHLCSTNGPMHYVANTVYFAGDKDCHGLREGETRQLRNGKTNLPAWEPVVFDAEGEQHSARGFPYIDSAKRPPKDGDVTYIPWLRVGEGKQPNIEAARSSAIWPDATLDQLLDEDVLAERLPALLADFQADVEGLGLTF